jgi:hypothetical protein
MIRTRQLTYLVLSTALLSAVALLGKQQANPPIPGDGQVIFPALMSHINTVHEIIITHAGKIFHIVKQDDTHWSLPEKNNAPVDANKVRDIIFGLSEMILVEPKTKNPALYTALGVTSPLPQNTSTEIHVKNVAGNSLAALIVGTAKPLKSNPNRQAFYIRKPQERQAWEAEAVLPEFKTPEDWLQPPSLSNKLAVAHSA